MGDQCVIMARLGILRELIEMRADSWLDARTFKFSSLLFLETALSLATKEKEEAMSRALAEHREKTSREAVLITTYTDKEFELAQKAAVKIQALQRGIMVRAKKAAWIQAAFKLQAIHREKTQRGTSGLALRRKAAVQIQRLFRARRQATEIVEGKNPMFMAFWDPLSKSGRKPRDA